MKRLIALILVVASVASAQQKTLSLQAAVDIALQRNVSVVTAQNSYEASQSSTQAAMGALLPSLDASGEYVGFDSDTAREVAKRLGVTAQTVARYEKGETDIPGPADKLLRFVYAMHLLTEKERKAVLDALNAALSEDADDRAPAPVYFGTTGGQVYCSPDAGDNWAPIVRDLPAVLSVEVQTLS